MSTTSGNPGLDSITARQWLIDPAGCRAVEPAVRDDYHPGQCGVAGDPGALSTTHDAIARGRNSRPHRDSRCHTDDRLAGEPLARRHVPRGRQVYLVLALVWPQRCVGTKPALWEIEHLKGLLNEPMNSYRMADIPGIRWRP